MSMWISCCLLVSAGSRGACSANHREVRTAWLLSGRSLSSKRLLSNGIFAGGDVGCRGRDNAFACQMHHRLVRYLVAVIQAPAILFCALRTNHHLKREFRNCYWIELFAMIIALITPLSRASRLHDPARGTGWTGVYSAKTQLDPFEKSLYADFCTENLDHLFEAESG